MYFIWQMSFVFVFVYLCKLHARRLSTNMDQVLSLYLDGWTDETTKKDITITGLTAKNRPYHIMHTNRSLILSTATLSTTDRLRPTDPTTQCVTSGVKRPGREADHSPSSSAEVKNSGAMPPLNQHVFMARSLINSTHKNAVRVTEQINLQSFKL
jgi:hypothetical protein